MFANTFMILNQNRLMNGEDDIVGEYLNNNFLDAEINQYLVGLGEFQYDNYAGDNSMLVWILFLGATFMT